MQRGELSGLIFLTGLGVLLYALLEGIGFGASPMWIGQGILAEAPERLGAANNVTSVVLAYRGLDTLGELAILFAAATAAGFVLGAPVGSDGGSPAGFILRTGGELIFPFLLLLGAYIILHGHLTPGGGFQGGAVLAAAFFIPMLATPGSGFDRRVAGWLETLAGSAFILIGLLALWHRGEFLAPLLGTGEIGALFSAQTLPLLYLAVGLKVGSELAALLGRLLQEARGA